MSSNSIVMTADNNRDKRRPPIMNTIEKALANLQMPEFFVEDLIPVGVTILAGPSKAGKSLLVTDLAHKVSAGEDFMGRPTHKAAVLIYSLEDSWLHLRDRLIKQGHVCTDPINSPIFRISAPTYYDGLKEEIEKFIQENGSSLIILDTLQLIAPPKTGNVNDYFLYDCFLRDISKMARENHSSIILIHHTTKALNENKPFLSIHGNRLSPEDAMIVITRSKKQLLADKATLHVTGRDIPMDKIEMVLKKDILTWVEAPNI